MVFGQANEPQFGFYIGGRSNVYLPKTIEGVQVPSAHYDIYAYETEIYDLNYNFSANALFQLGVEASWINKPNFKLKQTLSGFFGNYSDQLRMTLVDIGEGNPGSVLFTGEEPVVGYENTLQFSGNTFGFSAGLTALYKTTSGFNFGGGIQFSRINRSSDIPKENGSYFPEDFPRGLISYDANYLGVHFRFEKEFRFLQPFISLGQSLLIAKKEDQKGSNIDPSYALDPSSMNLDFRQQSFVEFGIAFVIMKHSRK